MHTAQALPAIQKQKNKGKKVIGCFPLYPPVELFTAMGLLPVVLWNLKNDTRELAESDRHIQNYACGIARELVQFVLAETGACLDGVFSYNACDTLRNLPEILARGAGNPVPMVRMHLPQVNRNHTNARPYLAHEITRLIQDTEAAFGVSLSPGAFRKTVTDYARVRMLSVEAENLVAKGAISFLDFSHAVLSGFFCPVTEQIRNLNELIAGAGNLSADQGTGVLISGIMPPPVPVIEAVEAAGLRVVANDIAALRRSYAYTPDITDDPVRYYDDFHTRRFPCTTLLYQGDERTEAFLSLVRSSGAKGVIFAGEKFCEYEYFEFPYLENRLRETGIPVLRLEFGIDDMFNTEAYTTRIQAFSELLS